MEKLVLVVDDEEAIVRLVTYNLEREGFKTVTANDGLSALDRVRSSSLDLVILDIMLPGLDGLEVCRRLRQEDIRIPVILLTARDTEIDKILGLELGADDYVTKPFSPRELVARVKAILRRSAREETLVSDSDRLQLGELVMDLKRHEVMNRGEIVSRVGRFG